VAALWSGAASADLFYGARSLGASSYGTVLGSNYTPDPNLVTSAYNYPSAFSFTDHSGKSWAVVDGYQFGSGVADTVDIYNLETWDRPFAERKDWGANISGLAVIDNYLYIAAFERYEGGVEKSGEIIRVDMTEGKNFAPDGTVYKFDAAPEGGSSILRRPCGIQVWQGKIYVLTYTYDGEHSVAAGMGRSEIFEFDENLKLTNNITIRPLDRASRNTEFMVLYNDKLYLASSGGALGDPDSTGAIWEVDLSEASLPVKMLVDLANINDPDFAGKNIGSSALEITKDGTVFFILGGYDSTDWSSAAKLYITTVAKLTDGDLGAPKSQFSGSGIVFDESLQALFTRSGNDLVVYDKGLNLLKTLTPSELGGDFYTMAVIGGTPNYTRPEPEGGGSGGGCDAGLGVFALLIASATLIKYRYR
jgi:hypothetical protein